MPQLPPPDPNEHSRRYPETNFVVFAIMALGALALNRCDWYRASPEMLRLGRSEMVHQAGRGGCSTGAVERFLDAGVDVNVRDRDGRTALHSAVVQGCTDTVRLLLERGAHPDIATPGGCTALMLAERHGHAEIARLLRQAGAADLPKDACCKACGQQQ